MNGDRESVCAARKCLRWLRARGRFCARPRYPLAGLSNVGGVHAIWPCPIAPRRCVPPTAALRSAARGGSPGRLPPLTPPCRGRRERLAWSAVTFTAACVPPSASRNGCTRGLNARPSVAQRPRSFGRFCAAFDSAAQIRLHAGCALAGDPLALSVCGRRRLAVIL